MRALAVLALLLAACVSAPPPAIPPNAWGLPVIDDAALYRARVRDDPRSVLVPLASVAPDIRIDVRYATADNFMKRRLYPQPAAFLRCDAALALAAAQRELASRGLGLRVYDGYRPYSVTVEMWEAWRDPDYVADPANGSRHNRGAAVDVTLVDLATGAELPMPTGYDDFTSAAAHDFADLPDEVIANRALLRDVMERHGFDALPSEWWHYDFRGWREYDLMDLPHAALDPPPAACPPR